jgi:protein involved in polysaccharide export with SLBB domain
MHMKLLRPFAGACLLLLLAHAPVAAQQSPPAQQSVASSWSRPIAPGDVLLLQVWREEIHINETVPQNGVVSFPRIGVIDVRGMSHDSLRARLVREYGKYVRDADSRIRLDVHRKVRVTGAVRNPNVYTLNPTWTLADAIAAAGGALPEGRRDIVELRRDGQVVQVLLLDESGALADSPVQSGDQLHVPERSFVSRNLSVLVTALTSVVAVGIAIATAK